MSMKHICLGRFLGRAGTVLSDESVGVREVGMLRVLSEIGVILGRW